MSTKTIATNRRARFDYEITESFEAGLVLLGSEVKSLRHGRADLKDAYGMVRDGELWLVGMHIAPYEFARLGGHEPELNLIGQGDVRRQVEDSLDPGFLGQLGVL